MAAMATENRPVPEQQEVEDRILAFLRRELLGSEITVERDDDLLAGELLDSIAVLRLATFVQEEFRFTMKPADFVIEHFQTVAVLAAYVQRATDDADRPPADSGL
jgi:acyl carrier protein